MGVMLVNMASGRGAMPSDFSNTDISKSIAKDFLKANKTEEVDAVLQSHSDFDNPENWKPYGKAEKNWDRIGVQTSEPVGALAELIINSIDAILMRKAHETGVSPRSSDAPKNMSEAVSRFFPEIIDGNLSTLSREQRTKIAEESVLIGIKRPQKRSKYPNYTIVDYGEGQNHDKFEDTFLSLGEKNKEGIPFVQGRFNMGSTGSIVFCTQSDIRKGHYKFILSKRSLSDSDGMWGWTLIRVRDVREGEELPVGEYFCPDGIIPHFNTDVIYPFPDENIGEIREGGSLVKLYEYDIGSARTVNLGLYDGLTTNLINCALPLRLYDFDAKPQKELGSVRAKGIASRTFSGANIVISGDEKDEEEDDSSIKVLSGVITCNPSADLGEINIFYFGLEKMKDYLKKHPHRFFYTINGQSQAKEMAHFLRSVKLDDLRNHLIVQIDCNRMKPRARSAIFKPDRERMSDIQLARELKDMVVTELSQDSRLKEFARNIRAKRVKEQVTEQTKNMLEELAKNSPELKELFDMGGETPNQSQEPGGGEEFEGKRFPTHLVPLNLDDENVKKLPINGYRQIHCRTDVEDEYLSREVDRGEFLRPNSERLPSSSHLHNGRLRIKIRPPENAKEHDVINVQFGFSDNNPASDPEKLKFDVNLIITEAEKKNQSASGNRTRVRTNQNPEKSFPDIRWVDGAEWVGSDYSEESGGYVIEQEDDKFIIYVNKDNRHLKRLVTMERDDSRRDLIRNRFKLGVGILTLAMYKRMVHDSNMDRGADVGDEAARLASSAVAPHVVTLIQQLGEGKFGEDQ